MCALTIKSFFIIIVYNIFLDLRSYFKKECGNSLLYVTFSLFSFYYFIILKLLIPICTARFVKECFN